MNNAADFEIKNCSVRNTSDNVQNAFAKNIRDTKAEVFKEKDVFFNKSWLDVTNNRELYFWSKFNNIHESRLSSRRKQS